MLQEDRHATPESQKSVRYAQTSTVTHLCELVLDHMQSQKSNVSELTLNIIERQTLQKLTWTYNTVTIQKHSATY